MSYMDRKNILNEGFFSKLFKMFKPKGKKANSNKADLVRKVAKDPKVKKSLKNLNDNTKSLEDLLSGYLGRKVTLNKFEVKDFFKK